MSAVPEEQGSTLPEEMMEAFERLAYSYRELSRAANVSDITVKTTLLGLRCPRRDSYVRMCEPLELQPDLLRWRRWRKFGIDATRQDWDASGGTSATGRYLWDLIFRPSFRVA